MLPPLPQQFIDCPAEVIVVAALVGLSVGVMLLSTHFLIKFSLDGA